MARKFLISIQSESGHILNLFLFSSIFEPQRSYKHGPYSTNSVYLLRNEGARERERERERKRESEKDMRVREM